MTAIVFGVWPALQLSRPDLGRVAQASARRVIGSAQGRRTHRVMVAVQVALTLLMLTAAGAAGKGFLRLANADLGYDPQNTMSLPIPVHDGTYQTWKERSEYFERLRARSRRDAAGRVGRASRPTRRRRRTAATRTLEILGSSALEKPVARANFVSPEYFPLLRIPIAQGRLWSARRDRAGRGPRGDQPDDGPAVLAEGRRHRPSDQVRHHEETNRPIRPAPRALTDGSRSSASSPTRATTACATRSSRPFYVPYTLKMRMFTQILVRTRVPPLSILRDVRAELVRVDREQQVMRVRDLQGWITNLPEYAQQALVARLFGIFSMLALALSAVGLYSVVSYGVATRTNEFGIRMALGAKARDVVRMVLSGTSWNVGAGLLAGVLLCLIFDRSRRDG